MDKTQWRLMELDVNSYAEATASISPAIARACEEGKAPNTLAMYTHQKASIVMGRQNDPDVDINYGYCADNDIIVKRIPTPGTIFGHPGYIMNVLYVHKDLVPNAIPDIFAMLNTQMAKAFTERWGVPARHRPINDLEVEMGGVWKKVGPFGMGFFGPCVCCRMGLTVTPIPYDIVENAMPGPPEKFADKVAKSVTQRVGSLEEALARHVDIKEAKEVVIKAISDLFGIEFHTGELLDVEKDYEKELSERYDNDDWFWANSISRRFPDMPEGASLHEYIKKIPQGPLVRVRALKKGRHILDCSLTGWYHGIRPLDALEIVESHLKETPCSEDAVLSRIEKAYQEGGIAIDQCSPTDLRDLIVQALEKEPVSK
ncbi:MAG: lipoate--protein ligase family protein [Deltaproteobacteria bacterium]|nr:lipoate--protein ligase family protein [Deltaproteobacteria bacterium]